MHSSQAIFTRVSDSMNGDIKMFRIENVVAFVFVFVILVISRQCVVGQHTYDGRNYGDAFS